MALQSAPVEQDGPSFESVIYLTNNGGSRPAELRHVTSHLDVTYPEWWVKFDAKYIVVQGEGKTMLVIDRDLSSLIKIAENTAILETLASASGLTEVGELSSEAQAALSTRLAFQIPQYVDEQAGLPKETALQFVPLLDITLTSDDHQFKMSIRPNLRPELEKKWGDRFYSNPLEHDQERGDRAAEARSPENRDPLGMALISMAGRGSTSHRALREAMELYEEYVDGEYVILRNAFDRAYEKLAQDYEIVEGPGRDDEVALRDLSSSVKGRVRRALSSRWQFYGFSSVSEMEVFSLEAKAAGRKQILISAPVQGKNGQIHGMSFTIIRP